MQTQSEFSFVSAELTVKKWLTHATLVLDLNGKTKFVYGLGLSACEAAAQCLKELFDIQFTLNEYKAYFSSGDIVAKSSGEKAYKKIISFVRIESEGNYFDGEDADFDPSFSFIRALCVCVNKLLVSRKNRFDGRGSEDEERMENILTYIDEHYMSASLDELAGTFFLSKSYISRYIREKSGYTFGELLKRSRLQHACSMLKNGNMKVEKVAKASGYPSVEHFNRVFKKEFGLTPLEYREAGQ